MNNYQSNPAPDTGETNSLYDTSFPSYREGEIVTGTIIKRVQNAVLVDIGLKAEGILPLEEFRNPDEAVEGRKIQVYIDALENKDGFPVLSKKKADFQLAWEIIKQKSESGEPVKAVVLRRVKGGLAVDVFGLDAFLPGSQVDLRPVPNLDALVNQELEVKILSVNWHKKNIVVSRRALLEERQEALRRELLQRIQVGDIIEGTVKTVTEFGAFIDIGGVDALLHISDLAWVKVVHPSEVVQPGEKLKVKVLSADTNTGRITVGLKQLTPHPWEKVEEKYPIGSRVRGRVTTLAEYGAFVELEKGIEGLIHISEMSWTKSIHHPAQLLSVDQEVEAVVLNIDKENRRISLGLKQTQPDPWSLIDERYKVGQRVTGKVKSLKDFGAFVELEEGIEGLIHNQDISWTKRIKHPREELRKGQVVETIILEIDKENRKISLGLKQTQEDPFYKLSQELKEGDIVRARIVDIPKPGLVVALNYGIEGFVPLSQLARGGGKKVRENYQIGEELELKVLRIDLNNRRVALSEKALQPKPEEKEEEELPPERPSDRFTLEDHLRDFKDF
ncbi:MAG: 30S ribosomal protein S1 [candidate division WOR-3 bacterium]|uniref:30S ribosomal protein S1 n=1 Tax=candidate division WOR-3 bacterium TaxID=2052148 RepID=A0A7C1SX48_UNCW3|nr:30S ribosomal protein S1 [candidate division WOR-3 bacterium]